MGKHNLFKSIGDGIKHGTKAVGHLVNEPVDTVKSVVHTAHKDAKNIASTVYKDGRSAVAYGGKHLINDVDGLASTLSNPILIIGVAVVAVVVISKL